MRDCDIMDYMAFHELRPILMQSYGTFNITNMQTFINTDIY